MPASRAASARDSPSKAPAIACMRAAAARSFSRRASRRNSAAGTSPRIGRPFAPIASSPVRLDATRITPPRVASNHVRVRKSANRYEPRRHKIPRARYRVTNWPEYDRALQRRGSLTVWVTPEALAAWHPPGTGRRGRSPQYAAIDIETGHLLRLAFGRPWRQTEGLLRSLATLLGVGIGIPDHTTFSRRSPGPALAGSLAQAQRTGPVHVVIDATGLKVYGAGEWLVEAHGERGRRSWRKLHLAVDPNTGEILASALTTTEEGDASQVSPLLEQITGPIASVIADGAYDGEPVYRHKFQLRETTCP